MKKYIIIFLLTFWMPILVFSQKNCWPSYRGNPELTGQQMWSYQIHWNYYGLFKTGDIIKSSPVVCGDNIFIGSNNGSLYSLSKSGDLNWEFKTETSIEAPPLYLDSIIFVGSLEGIMFALDANTGGIIWQYSTEGQITGSVNWAYSSDKKSKQIIFGSYDYFLHSLDAKTGKLNWKYETDNYINGAAATNGEIAIFGGCDGYLHLVNTNNGSVSDTIDIGTYIASSAAIDDNVAFFGNYDGAFFSVDISNKKSFGIMKMQDHIWAHQQYLAIK